MSGSIRLFVTDPLEAGAEAAGTAAQGHYLAHVMRRAVGAPVLLFNGRDGEWRARIAALRGDRVRFVAVERVRPQPGDVSGSWLVFALLKRDATDLVVRAATELGVAALLPVATERTNAARANLDRLRAIAAEAAEQSERLTVPDIREPVALDALLLTWPVQRTLFAALERSVPPAPPAAELPRPIGGLAGLLVGPEGGFTVRELDALGAHPFVVPVSLGPLILRAETAAIAGLALLQGPGFVACQGQPA